MATPEALIRLLGGALTELHRYSAASTRYGPLDRSKTALSLLRDWETKDGAFAEGADEREGLPVCYEVIYRTGIIFDAPTEAECDLWAQRNPHITPIEIKPGNLIWRRAERIKAGDFLWLENDPIADGPLHKAANLHDMRFGLLQRIVCVTRSAPPEMVIEGEGWVIAFPTDHLLKMKPEEDAE